MTADEHVYDVRYAVERWGKPAESPDDFAGTGVPRVRVAPGPWGYTDVVFVASILRGDDGGFESVLLLDSTGKPGCDRKVLEAVRDMIDHHLKEHAG